MNSLPKTVARHRRDCDLNPGCTSVQHANHSATKPPQLANMFGKLSQPEAIFGLKMRRIAMTSRSRRLTFHAAVDRT